MTSGRIVLAGAASAALYAVALAVIAVSGADQDHLVTAIAVIAGVAWVAAGLVALVRWPDNRTGWLMLAAGDLWALSALQLGNAAVAFTVGAVASQLAFGPWIHVTLAFPEGRLRERSYRVLVTLAYAALLAFPLLVALLDRTPLPTCDGCAESAIVIRDSPDATAALRAIGTIVGITLSAAFITVLVRRYRAASPPLRRVMGPVYLVSVCGLGAIIVANVAITAAPSTAGLTAGVVAVAFFGAVPIAFLAGLLRVHLARGSVAGLLTSFGQVSLRDALADALGDPSLAIVYPLETRWVDEQGRDADELVDAPTTELTPVEVEGEVVAALVHDASLTYDPGLVDGVVSAAALALKAQGLQAETRAQYAFLVTLVDTAPAPIIHIATDGTILSQNAAAVEVAGHADEEDVRGRPFWDVFIDPSERAEVIARFHADAPDFPPGEYENVFTNAAGERKVIFWRSAPVRGSGGAVTGIISGGIDITEREAAAAALEAERAFLNAIANNAPSLLCLIDEHGVVAPFASNRAFEQALELDPETVGGEVFWERYVAPEDAEGVRSVIERVAAGETIGDRDDVWLTSSGRRLYVAWSCTPLPPMDERNLLLVSGVDVTERRQRELELQRERDATTTVLESIPSIVVVVDTDGRIRDRDEGNPLAAVNRAFRQALGWRDSQLVGRSFLDLVVEDEDGRAAAALATAAAGSASDELESEWACADGSVRVFAWSAAPVSDVTGRRDALVLVAGVDVTERRTRELEDRRRRAFMETVTETIPTYLLVLGPDATIRESGANAAFTNAFGWTASEIGGESFLGTVVPANDHAAHMEVANAAQGIEQAEIESRWETRDGDSRIVAWRAQPVTDARGERLVLVAGTDVTERRLQEQEIRASRSRIVSAADEARRRLERDLHDGAQQRLVALSVSLRLAENRLTAGGEGVQEMLAEARAELARALEDLRELARGIHPAVLTDRGLGPALETLIARAPLPVTLDHPDVVLPPAIEAAAYFVVAESLTNVVKYAQASTAAIEVIAAHGLLTVLVRDDGVGGADPGAGTGLRGLVDRLAALDGRLILESEPGCGTCVRAEIPVPAGITNRVQP